MVEANPVPAQAESQEENKGASGDCSEAGQRLDTAVSNVLKRDIQEIKAFANPPKGVQEVFQAVHVLRTGVVA